VAVVESREGIRFCVAVSNLELILSFCQPEDTSESRRYLGSIPLEVDERCESVFLG